MEKDFIESIAGLIERDLKKLTDEISQYPNEETVWKVSGGIKNSAGNLCLHLCGNLQHFFGAVLGQTGYVRNRDHEFAAKGISKQELLTEIERTRTVVNDTLENLKPSLLLKPYPEKVFDYPMTSLHFFIHLSAHVAYHLGQVNYHRRLLAGN